MLEEDGESMEPTETEIPVPSEYVSVIVTTDNLQLKTETLETSTERCMIWTGISVGHKNTK